MPLIKDTTHIQYSKGWEVNSRVDTERFSALGSVTPDGIERPQPGPEVLQLHHGHHGLAGQPVQTYGLSSEAKQPTRFAKVMSDRPSVSGSEKESVRIAFTQTASLQATAPGAWSTGGHYGGQSLPNTLELLKNNIRYLPYVTAAATALGPIKTALLASMLLYSKDAGDDRSMLIRHGDGNRPERNAYIPIAEEPRVVGEHIPIADTSELRRPNERPPHAVDTPTGADQGRQWHALDPKYDLHSGAERLTISTTPPALPAHAPDFTDYFYLSAQRPGKNAHSGRRFINQYDVEVSDPLAPKSAYDPQIVDDWNIQVLNDRVGDAQNTEKIASPFQPVDNAGMIFPQGNIHDDRPHNLVTLADTPDLVPGTHGARVMNAAIDTEQAPNTFNALIRLSKRLGQESSQPSGISVALVERQDQLDGPREWRVYSGTPLATLIKALPATDRVIAQVMPDVARAYSDDDIAYLSANSPMLQTRAHSGAGTHTLQRWLAYQAAKTLPANAQKADIIATMLSNTRHHAVIRLQGDATPTIRLKELPQIPAPVERYYVSGAPNILVHWRSVHGSEYVGNSPDKIDAVRIEGITEVTNLPRVLQSIRATGQLKDQDILKIEVFVDSLEPEALAHLASYLEHSNAQSVHTKVNYDLETGAPNASWLVSWVEPLDASNPTHAARFQALRLAAPEQMESDFLHHAFTQTHHPLDQAVYYSYEGPSEDMSAIVYGVNGLSVVEYEGYDQSKLAPTDSMLGEERLFDALLDRLTLDGSIVGEITHTVGPNHQDYAQYNEWYQQGKDTLYQRLPHLPISQLLERFGYVPDTPMITEGSDRIFQLRYYPELDQ